MAYKVTISDGTILEKSIDSVTFNADTPPDNSYCMRTYTINSMQITGRIGAGEKTISLYEWALLPANNFNCYKEVVVEQTHADQTVRIIKFSKAFVVDYSENFSKGTGVGHFSIFIRQLAEVDIELTNKVTQQPTMTEPSNEVEEPTSPLVQGAGIVAASSIAKKSRPNITDILAKKKEETSPILYLPKSNGKWLGEEGNSEWVPDPEFIPKNPKTNPEELSWKQISEKYGVSSIMFVGGQPNFSPVSKGTVEIDDFSSERDDNFDSADEALAKKRGCTKSDVRRWRKKNKYTWHERKDCKTMDKVPTCVHGNVTHSGGISESKKGAH